MTSADRRVLNRWAVRNCGLMLFRACTSRLGKARVNPLVDLDLQSWTNEGDISIDRSPEVLALAIELLDPSCFSQASSESVTDPSKRQNTLSGDPAAPSVATERIFAALDLLGRVVTDQEGWHRIEPFLLQQMGSTFWQVRQQAARIFASRVPPWKAPSAIMRLLRNMSNHSHQNALHGQLICIRQIIRYSRRTEGTSDNDSCKLLAEQLSVLEATMKQDNISPMVNSAFIDIRNDLFEQQMLVDHEGSVPLHKSRTSAYRFKVTRAPRDVPNSMNLSAATFILWTQPTRYDSHHQRPL